MLWANPLFRPRSVHLHREARQALSRDERSGTRSGEEPGERRQSAVLFRIPEDAGNAAGPNSPLLRKCCSRSFRDLKIRSVEVPATFPVGLADQLRGMSIRVEPKPDPFWPDREFKTSEEVRYISESLARRRNGHGSGNRRRAPHGNSKGRVSVSGRYPADFGNSEDASSTPSIMAQGYVPSHTIAASGDQCVDPHNQGSGPIRANTSIIMDIFPRSQKTGYFGDITRTVVRGRASERLKHAYALCRPGAGDRISPDPGRRERLRHPLRNRELFFTPKDFPRDFRTAACKDSFTEPAMVSVWIFMKRHRSVSEARMRCAAAMS